MADLDYKSMSDVDVAFSILTEKGEPIYYRDLVMEVIEKKAKPVQSLANTISEVYTLINMDSRFQHMGKSMWGLTEWAPPEVHRTRGASKVATRDEASSDDKKKSRRREKLLESIQEE